jgi:hypothetical protein
VLTGAFFNELAGAAIAMRLLADTLKPSLRLRCGNEPLGEAVRLGGRALGTVHKVHADLSDEQLLAWAARAAQVAAMATATAVTCLAEFVDREAEPGRVAATAATPYLRRAAAGDVQRTDGAESITVEMRPARAPRGTDPGASSGEVVLWAHPDATPGSPPFAEPTCSSCGCTERNACHTLDGGTCSWVSLDNETNAGTCTACSEPA